MNVGLHHGGVAPELPAEDEPSLPCLVHQRLVQVFNDLVAVLLGQLDQRRVVRNSLVKRDAAEDPPHDGIPDVFDNHLVAELVTVLQVHDTKVSLRRHGRSAGCCCELGDKGSQELLIIQQNADLGELVVQFAWLRRQDGLINLGLGCFFQP